MGNEVGQSLSVAFISRPISHAKDQLGSSAGTFTTPSSTCLTTTNMFFRYVIPLVSGIACLVSGSEQQSPSGCVSRCKAVPGTPGWPSPDSWAALNASTGGRLLQPLPPGAVCHPDQPDYNATQCLQVQQGWTLSPFHDNDPVSVGSIEFTNDSCLPLATYPCSSEGYPVFVINATTADHVKLGVDFGILQNPEILTS